MKGTYILLIEIEDDIDTRVGKLGNIFFKKGFYVYIGSGLSGLEQRVNRHLRNDKKIHWHIDYLLRSAKVDSVYYKESNEKEECKFARPFSKLKVVDNFGSSDCKCKSHLFFGSKKEIKSIINSLDMTPYC
jgi:Uri superfamily endonuclease